MTTREKVERLLDRLSEAELEAEYARLLRERDADRLIGRSYEKVPQFASDGWSDLESVHEASRNAVLKRIEEEERAAGFEPW